MYCALDKVLVGVQILLGKNLLSGGIDEFLNEDQGMMGQDYRPSNMISSISGRKSRKSLIAPNTNSNVIGPIKPRLSLNVSRKLD